ncbi:hypothetical protein AX768_13375 [Burkholderia sp. PAMC 28687]|uniref:hypothetical protein n=1 Tax=Burkholderia sp. PAMC 28687 TaxID=1795874 RepID=UPI000782D852|nr:hypothetical protein [Burkholderia sp. PAMC 28687]AMM14940.1 hypothetical protein AX768_13375 [Burkholderia sp. PAMC 28687]
MSALPSAALFKEFIFIDNAVRCKTTAALDLTPAKPTPVKKPERRYDFAVRDDKAEHTFVQFRAEYVEPLHNEINAALMLSALVGWYQPNGKGESKLRKQDGNGVWWIAKSHSHWLTELGLSRKESTRATEILVKSGVIEVWKYPFDGHACNHYRLKCADGGSMLDGVPSFKELAHVPGGHTAMYPAGTSSCTPGVQLITDIQTKTTYTPTCKQAVSEETAEAGQAPGQGKGEPGKKGSVKPVPEYEYLSQSKTPHRLDLFNRIMDKHGYSTLKFEKFCQQDKYEKALCAVEEAVTGSKHYNTLETFLEATADDWELYKAVFEDLLPNKYVPEQPRPVFLSQHIGALLKHFDAVTAESVEPEAPVTAPEPVTPPAIALEPSAHQLFLDKAEIEGWAASNQAKKDAEAAKKAKQTFHA